MLEFVLEVIFQAGLLKMGVFFMNIISLGKLPSNDFIEGNKTILRIIGFIGIIFTIIIVILLSGLLGIF
jgi:hypothetical protein